METGYEKEPLGGSTWVYKQAGVTLEFHTKLASGDYWNAVDYEGYFLQYFSRLQLVEGCSERRLSPEEHFIFLLFHLAKHLNSSGAQIPISGSKMRMPEPQAGNRREQMTDRYRRLIPCSGACFPISCRAGFSALSGRTVSAGCGAESAQAMCPGIKESGQKQR